ncbi:hypothetical protein MN608_03113 [Microdochium nivale]|nr:hypothetical protein MN608_03113 [Microdochium nivale]
MDFLQYGQPTEEWTRYSTSQYKPVVSNAIPTTRNLSEVRAASNVGRVKWSASQVAAQDLAGKFTHETY